MGKKSNGLDTSTQRYTEKANTLCGSLWLLASGAAWPAASGQESGLLLMFWTWDLGRSLTGPRVGHVYIRGTWYIIAMWRPTHSHVTSLEMCQKNVFSSLLSSTLFFSGLKGLSLKVNMLQCSSYKGCIRRSAPQPKWCCLLMFPGKDWQQRIKSRQFPEYWRCL